MQLFSSSAPVPDSDRGHAGVPAEHVPGPAAVPPKEPRKQRFALWGALLALVLLAGGAVLYRNSTSAARRAGSGGMSAVPVMAAAFGDLHTTIRVNGTVGAQNLAALMAPRIQGSRSGMNRGGTAANFGGAASPTGGGGGGMGDFSLILIKLAKGGMQVKNGDVVAEFDPQMQVERLDDYRDSVVQLENSIRKTLATLAATKETHDQTVRSAKADWDKAVLDLQTAPVRSQIDAEKYKLAVEQAEANYKELLNESALLDESQRAQIRLSDLNRAQAKIELQRAEANVRKMTMKAPMSGIVVMQSIVRNGEYGQVREGDQVYPGQTFMQIVDPSSMVLNATVNQVDAEKLRMGMQAIIRLDAYPDIAVPGTLIGIGAMSKTSTFRASYVGEIPVRLKIGRTDARIIPDLTGSADIELSTEQHTFITPREAIFEEAGIHPFVFLKGPEGWIRRPVELGPGNNTAVAVRSGLRQGDVIALQRPM